MMAIVDKNNLEVPEMHDTVTIDLPLSEPIEDTSEPTIVVDKHINHIKNAWKAKYGISKPTLDLQFEMVKTYENKLTQEAIEARNRSLELLNEVKQLRNQSLQQRESNDED
jgi:hypothetical protein